MIAGHTANATRGCALKSIVIFSDDWGRHSSSCQHLTRQLLDRYKVLWVNTIGTRAPRLDMETAKRVTEKLRQWGSSKRSSRKSEQATTNRERVSQSAALNHPNLSVVNPKMWPWFGSPRARRINRWLLSKQLAPLIEQLPQPVAGLTTLPITADLAEILPVDRWIYYCVDDFSQWPGLDGETLRRMDHDMIQRADSIVAVSAHLQAMIANEGRSSSLLTHGVDVEFWQADQRSASTPDPLADFTGPRIVFWGVIDRRTDSASIQQLSSDLASRGSIILIGPQQDPDPIVLSLPNVFTMPAQPMSALPEIARRADVLIMPYADLPVTRAMQPLKLKEYLATGRPVVVNRLPSTDAWSDCLDVAETPQQFSHHVRERISMGVCATQIVARRGLQQESWRSKAEQLDRVLNNAADCCPVAPPTGTLVGLGNQTERRNRIPVGGATGQQ